MSKVTATIIVTILATIGGINLYTHFLAQATSKQITTVILSEREEMGSYESIELYRNGYARVIAGSGTQTYTPKHKQGWYVVTDLIGLKKIFSAASQAANELPNGTKMGRIQKVATWREAKVVFDDNRSIEFVSVSVGEHADQWADELFSIQPSIQYSYASEAAIKSISDAF